MGVKNKGRIPYYNNFKTKNQKASRTHFTPLLQQIHEWPIGNDRVKSKIEIDPATQMDAGVYECTADNMYSIDRRSFKTDFSIAFD